MDNEKNTIDGNSNCYLATILQDVLFKKTSPADLYAI